MAREYHVSGSVLIKGDGSKESPFKTINEAAKIAKSGDIVTVHEGVYRECVEPYNGGSSDSMRITYKSAKGEKAVIKGSEIIDSWVMLEGNVWKVDIDNKIFGKYNPFQKELFGDWFIDPLDYRVHTGDVYLNGQSLYEAKSLEAIKNPIKRTEGFSPVWTGKKEAIQDPEATLYQWFAEVKEESTTIYANFQEANPNEETVEINVRMSCFYPDRTGINYITVSGFEMCQAASPWAPPTGNQPGLIGPNWSKGWIIEDNIIHDAKCSAISIGKEASTGDNDCTKGQRKPGYQYQMEAVFKALNIGWSKETIGSHIIRNNVIYDCGQNAIVGHLGCAFSEIYNNHIYRIATKHEYYGYEIAGIKLHAAIDVHIHDNNIHNTTLGIWLDWQAQGARVSKNLFYENDRDLFIEVTHGPHLVDNNIFASEYFYDNIAWGGAHVNNLICGTMRREPVLNRATPYHYPHSTKPMGTTFVYGGDDRWYQNIFIGGAKEYTHQAVSGTSDYNDCPSSYKEYKDLIGKAEGDLESFEPVKDAVYMGDNAYLNGAMKYKYDKSLVSSFNPNVKIVTEGKKTYLEVTIDKELFNCKGKTIATEDLGEVRIVEQAFENPDGSRLVLDSDYNGTIRNEYDIIGPLVELKEGENKILIWED
ncbi:MAG: right-handed parallel beta-helix repeat-containing protein [Suipraeoptans sp.]